MLLVIKAKLIDSKSKFKPGLNVCQNLQLFERFENINSITNRFLSAKIHTISKGD